MKFSASCSVVSNFLRPHGLYSPWNSPGQNTGIGSRSLLQGIFPTQGLNWGLLHCSWILYQLSHKGNPRILEWVPIPSPADFPNPEVEPGSPTLQADSLPTELSGKPYFLQVEVTKLSPLEERINISPKGNIPQPTFKLPH